MKRHLGRVAFVLAALSPSLAAAGTSLSQSYVSAAYGAGNYGCVSAGDLCSITLAGGIVEQGECFSCLPDAEGGCASYADGAIACAVPPAGFEQVSGAFAYDAYTDPAVPADFDVPALELLASQAAGVPVSYAQDQSQVLGFRHAVDGTLTLLRGGEEAVDTAVVLFNWQSPGADGPSTYAVLTAVGSSPELVGPLVFVALESGDLGAEPPPPDPDPGAVAKLPPGATITVDAALAAAKEAPSAPVSDPDLAKTDPDLAAKSAAMSGGVAGAAAGAAGAYSGGPVMKGLVKIYYVWYGNWGWNSAKSILDNFAQHIGDSGYFAINTGYYDGSGSVNGAVYYGGYAVDNYSHGNNLSETDVRAVVSGAISSGQLPNDSNGVYFVLTSKDVAQHYGSAGFCSDFCGWHDHGSIGGQDIKYAFVGNPDHCPSPASCEAQTGSSPNSNPAADAMVSVVAHELEEAATDPDLNAWNNFGSGGWENADMCAWTFGNVYTAPNGSHANMKLGTLDYYIQRNWVNQNGGYCNQVYGLPFWGRDFRTVATTDDWHWGSYKAECGQRQAVTGLSRSTSSTVTHSALCGDDSAGIRYPHDVCHTVDFSGGDNRGTGATGDWDYGYFKGECGPTEYVAGVSQKTNGKIDSLLCCAGGVTHSSCNARVFSGGDNRGTTSTGDWDFLYYKGECAPNEYVAGVSREVGPGGPHAILCCSP